MSRNDRVVFLLGAGASVAQGLPVMSEFLGVARRRVLDDYESRNKDDLQRRDLQRLLEFYRQCRASAHTVNRDWENIEELYTQADLRRIAEIPSSEEAQDLCDSIAWAIWDIYRADKDKSKLGIGSILGLLEKAKFQPAIVTTNYDLVVERAISKTRASDGFNYYRYVYPGFFLPEEANTSVVGKFDGGPFPEKSRNIPVIKLHGSVNWLRVSTECYAFYDRGLDPEVIKQDRDRRTLNQICTTRSEFVGGMRHNQQLGDGDEIVPAIVPPMLSKSSDIRAISAQWSASIEMMKSARQLWIVGYSFPQTDAFMSRLLCEGLQEYMDLDFVAIANLESIESYAPRLRQLFNPTFCKNKVRYFGGNASGLFAALARHQTWDEVTPWVYKEGLQI